MDHKERVYYYKKNNPTKTQWEKPDENGNPVLPLGWKMKTFIKSAKPDGESGWEEFIPVDGNNLHQTGRKSQWQKRYYKP